MTNSKIIDIIVYYLYGKFDKTENYNNLINAHHYNVVNQ